MKKLEKTTKKGTTNPKKDKKEWKDPLQEREKNKKTGKRKIFFKRERVSFCSHSSKSSLAHISTLGPFHRLVERSRVLHINCLGDVGMQSLDKQVSDPCFIIC